MLVNNFSYYNFFQVLLIEENMKPYTDLFI
jgi:hypothetical protein